MKRSYIVAAVGQSGLETRSLIVASLLALSAVAVTAEVAQGQASFAQECIGLVGAFDEMRRSVESDLDDSASRSLADFELFGMSLSPETILGATGLVHDVERWMEDQTRNWLNVGPKQLNLPDLVRGRRLTKVGVGGERTWFSLAVGDVKKVRVTVNKTGGRAETAVSVCRWPATGGPAIVENDHIFHNGTQTPRKRFVVDDLNNEYITVHLMNQSLANNFEYNLRLEVLERYPKIEEEQQPSFSVTTVGGGGEVLWGPYFWMDIFPSDSDGSGVPLATTGVMVAKWSNGGETLFVDPVEPMVGIMFRPPIERRPTRLRSTGSGNLADAISLNKRGDVWLGTLKGSDGNTYRIRLRSRPAP